MNKIILLALSLICRQISIAQSHYPGQHTNKFAVEDKLKPAIYSFDLQDIRLLESRFLQNMEREQKWLMSLGTNRLLHSFRTNAGVYSGSEGGYDDGLALRGWESLDCELRGHIMGHILSGLALMYASTGDAQYKRKGDSLVSGLYEVQKALNQYGYLSAFPQELINRNLAGKPVWAPLYTLHKILSGLLDQYLYCDNTQALAIALKMGDWAYGKLGNATPEQHTKMLQNEFGGINESFYNLYAISGDQKYKWLAEFFYHHAVLDPLKEQQDILAGKHANTYIPKIIGLTRDYELEMNSGADSIASFFWETVVTHHTFCTGSNSDKEHFFRPDDLSAHLTGYTGESCNVYNMLKLTRHLYCHTGDIKYADFYEKALYNHILGQQDPATGMIAYFLPMLPGAYKVYSTPDSSFWCCVGSGFENQAKYGEAIYYHSENSLFINLFIPSELNWKEKGLTIRQDTRFPEENTMLFTMESTPRNEVSLQIRYPGWATNGASVRINGKEARISQAPGHYIVLRRKWKEGDKVELSFPMTLTANATKGDTGKVSFAYGPIVLAGVMGTDSLTGRAPYSNPTLHNDYYTYDYHVPAGITQVLKGNAADINTLAFPLEGKKLTFQTVTGGVELRPLYDIHRERYVVYWDIAH
jgi:DUF1680 family protein